LRRDKVLFVVRIEIETKTVVTFIEGEEEIYSF